MTNTDYLYALLSEGKLDLMYLPSGAVAWLFDRPESQVQSAAALGMMAKDTNPIVGGACLRADENVLILSCEGGQKFRVYPDGGISSDGQVVDLDGCQEAIDNVPQYEIPPGEGDDCGPGCPCPSCQQEGLDIPVELPSGFENMASPMDEDEGCEVCGDYTNDEMEEVARAQGTYEFSNESMKDLSRFSYRFDEDKLSYEELIRKLSL